MTGIINKIISLSGAFLLLFAVINTADAQTFKASVSSGFNLAQIDGDEVYGFKKTGYTGGIGVMMPFNMDKTNEGFQLSMEINFSVRGAKNSNVMDPFGYNATLNYVDIPLMLHYVDSRAGVTVGAGLQYGRLIKSKEYWTLFDTLIRGMERPLHPDEHSFLKNDLSVVGDFRFNIYKNLKFDIRWQYSLIPIRKDVMFFNSYEWDDDYRSMYKEWSRNYKSHYITLKLIYVINEEYQQNSRKYNRRRR